MYLLGWWGGEWENLEYSPHNTQETEEPRTVGLVCALGVLFLLLSTSTASLTHG